MNAYSNFADKRSSNTVERRLRSRAYRAGFCQGLGAPGLFFLPSSYPRASAIDANVAAAWKAVGKALEEAAKRGGEERGKGTGKELACK